MRHSNVSRRRPAVPVQSPRRHVGPDVRATPRSPSQRCPNLPRLLSTLRRRRHHRSDASPPPPPSTLRRRRASPGRRYASPSAVRSTLPSSLRCRPDVVTLPASSYPKEAEGATRPGTWRATTSSGPFLPRRGFLNGAPTPTLTRAPRPLLASAHGVRWRFFREVYPPVRTHRSRAATSAHVAPSALTPVSSPRVAPPRWWPPPGEAAFGA